MGLEGPKSQEEIQEEYVALWQSVYDEVATKLNAHSEFGIYNEEHAMLAGIEKIEMKDESGEVIGYIDFKVLKKDSLYINYSETKEGYLNQGVYKAILARILIEHPNIKVVFGELMDFNQIKYIEGLNQGMNIEEAMRNTPAYKAASTLGFSTIKIRGDRLICFRDLFEV